MPPRSARRLLSLVASAVLVFACGPASTGGNQDPGDTTTRVFFNVSSLSFPADGADHEVEVTASRAATSPITVTLAIDPNGTALGPPATYGTDYTLAGATSATVPFTVTIDKGATKATIQVHVFVPAAAGASKSFGLRLQTAMGAAVDTSRSALAVGLINGVSPVASLVTDGSFAGTVAESAGSFDVQVRLSALASTDLPFKLVSSGTATEGDDFTLSSGDTFTLPAGQNSLTVTITIVDDALFEPDETIDLALESADGAVQVDPTASTLEVTVQDDDTPTVTVSGPSSVAEGSGDQAMTISLGAALTQDVVVGYTATSETLAAGTEYVLAGDGATVTIPAGQTSAPLAFTVLDDDTFTCGGTLRFTLTTIAPGASPTATIALDGSASAVVSYSDNEVPAPGTNALTLLVTYDPDELFTMSVEDAAGNIIAYDDEAYHSASFTLPANAADGDYTLWLAMDASAPRPLSAMVYMNQAFCLSDSRDLTIEATVPAAYLTIHKSGDHWTYD